ncbi:MAG: tRNA (adenosine(37)-N6)-threonylcarbamoyltransferase complex ATPase subunit type 1 TsaE [Acidimicrobiales bacterium]
MTWERRCVSDVDTREAGREFAPVLRRGDIVLLSGTLGAGKTTFVQGVAQGLGVRERVTSPTFTVVREHECHHDGGIATLHHCDVYRVQSLDEVLDLALGELVEEDGVALVEWGELASSVFGRDVLSVNFAVEDDETRTVSVDGALAHERRESLDEWSGS